MARFRSRGPILVLCLALVVFATMAPTLGVTFVLVPIFALFVPVLVVRLRPPRAAAGARTRPLLTLGPARAPPALAG